MTTRLNFITETAKARLYSDSTGTQFWIPKSVCPRVLKFPPKDPALDPVHEVTIEDWWWQKHQSPDPLLADLDAIDLDDKDDDLGFPDEAYQ